MGSFLPSLKRPKTSSTLAQDGLPSVLAKLSTFTDAAKAAEAAANVVEQKEKDMVRRLQEAAADYYQECDKIIEALSQVHKEMHELLARDKARPEKADAERLEELETTAEHLEAAIAAADAKLSSQLDAASLDTTAKMLGSMHLANPDVVLDRSAMAVGAPHWDALPALGKVESKQVDPITSFVKGQATFVPGVPVELDIYPRFANGEPATYVRETDITLTFQNADDNTSVKPAAISYKALDAPFRWRVQYAFHSDVRAKAIRLVVRIHGIVIGEPWIVRTEFSVRTGENVRHVRTYAIGAITMTMHHAVHNVGLVVDPLECWMAVNFANKHTVTYYELPSGAMIREVGKHGRGPGEFNDPGRMCLCGPRQNHILVCDSNNYRVQELDEYGVYVRELHVPIPYSIACNRDSSLIAVGRQIDTRSHASISAKAAVVLFDYASGNVIRTIGTLGVPEFNCRCLRFTPAGDAIVVFLSKRLSMFALDGTLVKQQRDEKIGVDDNDVDFTVDGDVVVANYSSSCIDVYASDSLALQASFARKIFNLSNPPSALTVSGGHLYVRSHSGNVLVFE